MQPGKDVNNNNEGIKIEYDSKENPALGMAEEINQKERPKIRLGRKAGAASHNTSKNNKKALNAFVGHIVSFFKDAKKRRVFLTAVICVLLIFLMVLISGKSAAEARVKSIKTRIDVAVTYSITKLSNKADLISKPGADLKGDILPELKLQIGLINEYNAIIMDMWSEDELVADKNTINRIYAAISEIESLNNSGKNIDSAVETLSTNVKELVRSLDTVN